jgi:hypothetical protein
LPDGPATNGTGNGEPTTNGRASLETNGSRPTGRDSDAASVRSIKSIPKMDLAVQDLAHYGKTRPFKEGIFVSRVLIILQSLVSSCSNSTRVSSLTVTCSWRY